MKKIFLSFIWIIFLWYGYVEANIFTEKKIWNITLQYVVYPVWSDIYDLHVVKSDSVVSINNLALSQNALTWINGIFFCPSDYTECGGRNFTINERIIDGIDYSFYDDTWDRWIFWWTELWEPLIHQTNTLNTLRRWEIFQWMWNFPIILFEWRNMLEHYHDVWLIDNRMRQSMNRHFICSNASWSEIFFGRSSATSLDSLAPALHATWCYNALNLDAWASSQFLYNGRRLVSWSRNVLDGFVISHSAINVIQIEEEMTLLVDLLRNILARWWDIERSNERRNTIIAALFEARNQIHNRFSVDIYNEQWLYLWYRLEVTNFSELERLYRINKLERSLSAMRF